MNGISIFLYLAGVLGTLKDTIVIVSFLTFLVVGIYAIFSGMSADIDRNKSGPNWSFIRKAFIAVAVLLSINIFLPSKETVYMIAASETTEAIATSEDGRAVLKELSETLKFKLQELRKD